MNNNNYIVIMAGGVGSRFWPMSTEEKPKQFLDVLGIGKSLLQQTVARFKTLAPAENILIVTSAKYKALVAEQCPELLESNILLEPCMRNTAPCIAYAAYKIKGLNPDANIVVAPSDHLITNEAEFTRIIENGLNFTANNDTLLTLGIQPHRPETGYGYIQSVRNEELIISNKKRTAYIGSEGDSYETMPCAEGIFPPSGGTERGVDERDISAEGTFPPSGGTEGGVDERDISAEGIFPPSGGTEGGVDERDISAEGTFPPSGGTEGGVDERGISAEGIFPPSGGTEGGIDERGISAEGIFPPSGGTERGIDERGISAEGIFPPSGGTEGGVDERDEGMCKVAAFKEKPNLATAQAYLAAGNYFWNSGIFLWSLQSILDAFETHLPGVAELFEKGTDVYNTEKEQAFIDEMFPTCTNISIDYGIMEKAGNIYVQPADFGWSDLGTWGSLWEKRERCEQGNTVVGEKVQLFGASNCIVNMPKDKKVVIQGLNDCIVVEDNDVLLICKKEEEQRIKEFRAAVLNND